VKKPRQQLDRELLERARHDRETRRAGVVDGLREEDYQMPTGKTWFWGDPDEDGGGA